MLSLTVTAERARQQADEVDKKIADGESLGCLQVFPLTVKDIFCVEGTLQPQLQNTGEFHIPLYSDSGGANGSGRCGYFRKSQLG